MGFSAWISRPEVGASARSGGRLSVDAIRFLCQGGKFSVDNRKSGKFSVDKSFTRGAQSSVLDLNRPRHPCKVGDSA